MQPHAHVEPVRLDSSSRRRRRPTVSVCIVNWNCREHLKRCLRTLTSSRQGVRLEVIVVDNASTDGAAEMVEQAFPRAKLLRNAENRGFARANNQAAQIARGRYLFFLNNDTEVPAKSLQRLCRHFRRHQEAGLIGPCLRDPSGGVQLSVRRQPSLAALLHRMTLLRWTGLFRRAYKAYRGREVPTTTSRVEVLMGAALLIRRKLFRQLGGWDEGFTFGGEDIDLCTRVAQSHDVIYHPEVEIVHHGRVSSRKHTGYAHAHTLVGIVRCLRLQGTPSGLLLLYKFLFTLDLPLRACILLLQYLFARVRGRTQSARRPWLDLVGIGYFLRHVILAFWRA